MTAPDRPPLPDRSPPSRRRATPDPPTQKITAATAATRGTAVTAGSAATTTVGDQDGGGRFGLSVIQIVASTAAAVTAAVIGSRLGVAGTLTGAALASVVSGVGAAVYGHSLLVTRRRVTRALRLVRPGDATPATPAGATPAAPATPVAAGRRPSRPRVPGPDDDPTVVIPRAGPPEAPAPSRSRRPLTAVLAGAAAAVVIFAGSMATVTLVERVKGTPLSGGSGLTILGGNTSPDTRTTTDPTTVTSRASNSGATTQTATVTQTLTRSPTPSSNPTVGSSTAAPTSSNRSSAGSAPSSPRASAAAAAGQSPATAPPTAP